MRACLEPEHHPPIDPILPELLEYLQLTTGKALAPTRYVRRPPKHTRIQKVAKMLNQGQGRKRCLQIRRREMEALCNAGEHFRTDLVSLVESPGCFTPRWMHHLLVRRSFFRFDSPSQPLNCRQNPTCLSARPLAQTDAKETEEVPIFVSSIRL